jgi:hypothetical protein
MVGLACIMQRDDRLYRFVGEAVVEEDRDRFWTPCEFSGLYQSAEDTQRAARQLVLWLRDQNSN